MKTKDTKEREKFYQDKVKDQIKALKERLNDFEGPSGKKKTLRKKLKRLEKRIEKNPWQSK